MDIDEMIQRAAAPCHECQEPVQRVEMSWHFEGINWRLGPIYMVCGQGHRVPVEPFDPRGD